MNEEIQTIMIEGVWHIIKEDKKTICGKSTRLWQLKFLGDVNLNTTCKKCLKIFLGETIETN